MMDNAPEALSLNQTGGSPKNNICILAVDAGGSSLKTALVQLDGTPIPESRIKVSVDSDGPVDAIKAAYQDMIRRHAEQAHRLSLHLAGIGVSICGPFNFENGFSLMTHKYPALYQVPLRPWFQDIMGPLPVYFIHDSTAFILGETWQGPHSIYDRICGVMLGTGFGFGAIIDGDVYLNDSQGPGIILYNRPYRDGIVEDYVSRRGILACYRKHTKNMGITIPDDAIDVREIGDLADEGHPAACQTFHETGQHLAAIVRPVIESYRFQALVLGGQIGRSSNLILPPVRKALSDLTYLTCIEQALLIDDAALLGIARTCWHRLGYHSIPR